MGKNKKQKTYICIYIYTYIYREERERNTSRGEGGSCVADLQPVSVLEKPQGTEGIESAGILGATWE